MPDHPPVIEAFGRTDGRSRGGGERDALRALLGDVRSRSVLDLGCTDPLLARDLLQAGAARYVGLAHGDSRYAAAVGTLRGTAAEVRAQDLDRWAGHDLGRFDVALSRRALHTVRNLARLLDTLYHHLLPEGRLVFSVLHPLWTVTGPGGYFDDGPPIPAPGAAPDELPARHRRFDAYVRELRYSGFRLEELIETAEPIETADLIETADAADGPAGAPACAVFRCSRRG